MAKSVSKINVYFEVGKKRTFAGALDWPGWCRSGRDESSALQALFKYGPRYARVLRNARLGFQTPKDVSAFRVVERLEGNATTDFGAPGLAPSYDTKPVSPEELQRFQKILRACWRAFDASVKSAAGKTLRSGPRGGGRELEGIIEHVLGADSGYLTSLGWKVSQRDADDLEKQRDQIRQAILKGLAVAARGEIPAKGPRGGTRWTPRYYVRRAAWHVLDHAWELEDRAISE
ncbi:MAG TPA: hypothetical protein VJ821_15055 [Anaerolineales bacterium]|nr:hypothetical protein [Anaerolineales bacterium]